MYVVCGEEMITCYNAVMARVVMRVFVRLVDIVYCGETRKGSGEIRWYSLRIYRIQNDAGFVARSRSSRPTFSRSSSADLQKNESTYHDTDRDRLFTCMRVSASARAGDRPTRFYVYSLLRSV